MFFFGAVFSSECPFFFPGELGLVPPGCGLQRAVGRRRRGARCGRPLRDALESQPRGVQPVAVGGSGRSQSLESCGVVVGWLLSQQLLGKNLDILFFHSCFYFESFLLNNVVVWVWIRC